MATQCIVLINGKFENFRSERIKFIYSKFVYSKQQSRSLSITIELINRIIFGTFIIEYFTNEEDIEFP